MAGLYKKNPFVLPERLNPSSLDEEYDRKRFKEWVSELSIGNVSDTARALHSELNRLNHLEMSPVERFDALEMMLPSLTFVLEKLNTYLISVPVPLSKKNRLVARLHLELLIRLVVGYKTVLAQFHDDTFTGYLLHKRSRSESVRRALYYLGYLLRHEYSVYKTTPKFVWKEIHGYYFYAVANELHNAQVDAEDDPAGGLGVTDLYKQIVLLGLADPNGMLKGEVRKVHEEIPRWLGNVSLSPITKDASLQRLFVINSQKDAPPFLTADVELEKIKKGWFLDTDELVSTLEQEIEVLKKSGDAQHRPIDAVSLKLLTKLVASWGRGIKTREKRHKRAGIIDVTCGLESIFLLFGGGQIPDAPTSKPSSPFDNLDLDELSPITPTLGHDEFVIDAEGELGGSDNTEPVVEEEIELDILNSGVMDEIDSQECISVNESKRGCYLTWPGEGEYKAHVGELIGINPRDNLDLTESWALGIIRWLRIQSHGLMGFGVELLSGDLEPVRVERIENGNVADVMLGFKLSSDEESLSVITHPIFISNDDRYELVTKTERIAIIPGQILECTDAIMRFEVTADESGLESKKEEDKQYSASDDPFNSIWDKLQI